MKNFYSENSDIKFYVEKFLDFKSVLDLHELNYENPDGDGEAPKNFSEAFDNLKTILEYVGQISAEEFYPRSRPIDHKGGAKYNPTTKKVDFPQEFNESYQLMADGALLGMPFRRKFGGMNCSQLATTIASELISSGDAALMITGTLGWGVGNIIEFFGDENSKNDLLPKLATGEYGGAMVLTEPDAGSDLGNVRTTATFDDATQTWLINGNKIFISNGQSRVHLVLARTEPNSIGDVRGLSLFIVDGTKANIIRTEEKLGIHGSATCQLKYQNVPGILIGKKRFGLVKYMFALMNEARLGTATQGLGIAQIAYLEAMKYADEREQFGTKIKDFPGVARLLNDIRIDIEATRAIIYQTSYFVDRYMAGEKYLEFVKEKIKKAAAGKEKDDLTALQTKLVEDIKKYRMYSDVLTPLCKMRSGTMVIENTSKALQVFGGAGYTKEFDAERHLRDARIIDIYEGTGQLQSKQAISGVLNKYLWVLIDEIETKVKGDSNALKNEHIKKSLANLQEAKKLANDSIDHIISLQGNSDYEKYLHLFEGRLCKMTHEVYAGYLLLSQSLINDHKKLIVDIFTSKMKTRVKMWSSQVIDGNLTELSEFSKINEN